MAQGLHVKISKNGIELIKRFEGCKLKAYKCPADFWTIGYGSTGSHVNEGLVITQAEADALLLRDLLRFELGVMEVIDRPMTQGQFDALVSFAFNVGLGALRGSTLARKFKAVDIAGAAEQFERWNMGGGKVLPGLVKRREAERALFESD
jgi:lysozyme